MFFAITFVCTRISQIVTLLCTMSMLAWFIHQFVDRNALTPDSILVLFIVSVLALSWAVFTLFSYHRSSANARFVALIDIAIVGALIAGIYQLRGIADSDCSDPAPGKEWTRNVAGIPTGSGFDWPIYKGCAMLKASWAFSIMNCVFFAWTSVAAFTHGDHLSARDEAVVVRRSRHHSGRHSHRHHSRSGSQYSGRSPHSHRRVYV